MKRIRKGDLVQVMSGADRGKQGRVIAVNQVRDRVRVERVRMQKHHLKPGARASARQGGIIEQEGFIHASNVMLVDPNTNKPARIRVGEQDGKRVRTFVASGDPVPEPAS